MTPRLRRYARALTTGGPGACDVADDLVQATLMRALGSRGLGSRADLPIRLYATVTQLHRDVALAGKAAMTAAGGRPALVVPAPVAPSSMVRSSMARSSTVRSPTTRPSDAQGSAARSAAGLPAVARQGRLPAALLRLPLDEREALLLVALEGFDHGDAARILRVSRSVLFERLTMARTLLDEHLHARPAAPAPRDRSLPHLRLVT